MGDNAPICLKVKPTSGGEMIAVNVQRSATVLELKEEVSKACDTEAQQIRLIYKGAWPALPRTHPVGMLGARLLTGPLPTLQVRY